MCQVTTLRRHMPGYVHDNHVPGYAQCNCDVETAVLTSEYATEIFAHFATSPSNCDCSIQARSIYNAMAQLLDRLGAEMSHVVLERIAFTNIIEDYDDFDKVRIDAYRRAGVDGKRLPLNTCLQQPPCRPGQNVDLQMYAVVPKSAELAAVETLPSPNDRARVRLVRLGEARHLFVNTVTGVGSNGNGEFSRQSDAMFSTTNEILTSQGLKFSDVLRTWLYLDDIDRDYDDLNTSRNDFFLRENVRRLPASTGIGAGLCPLGTRCSLDLYTLMNQEIADIEIMCTPTLNEAPEYGSAFSRGMKVALPDRTYLIISGTASVDEQGATVNVDDTRAQIERMLLNVEELLRPHGATFADMVQAVTFLKSAESFELYREICAAYGVTDIPHSIVEADVCRPDLLCEMEAVAILPSC